MPKPFRFKAGALLSVLGIAIIVALLLGLMLSLLLYNRNDTTKLLRRKQLERDLASVTTILLDQPYAINDSSATLDLFDDNVDSVSFSHFPWGIFELGQVCSFTNGDTLAKALLMGMAVPKKEQYALYLADEDRPLSLSGATIIRGDAYLPPAGVRKAYIEDKSYEGDSTVYGKIRASTKRLPALQDEILTYLRAFNYDSLITQKEKFLDFAKLPDSLSQSFFQKPLLISSADSIALHHITLKGALVLVSKKAIMVSETAEVGDILLFAPTIHIAKGFNGHLQAFAQDSLIVDDNCKLQYPSVLGLLKLATATGVAESQSEIKIGKKATLQGFIFSTAENPNPDFLNKITIGQDALVEGQVYADGLLELKGNIFGTVLCKRFVLQTESSWYDNFLLDATIDRTKLSTYYLGSPLMLKSGKKEILKWLE